MNTARRLWLLPTCLLALATMAGLLAFAISGLPLVQSALLGVAVFCSFAILFLYGWVIWRSRVTEKMLHESLHLEREILGRLKSNEALGSGQVDQSQNRLSVLEQRVDDMERQIDREDTVYSAVNPDGPDGIAFDDKVVPLQAARASQTGRLQTRPATSGTREVTQLLDEGRHFFRLQPIVNLLDKSLVGLQASMYFTHADRVLGLEDFADKIPAGRRVSVDLKMVTGLCRLLRQLEKDGRMVPLHFRPISLGEPVDGQWESLLDVLNSDTRVLRFLIPEVLSGEFSTRESRFSTKLLGLRESGLKPCLLEPGSFRQTEAQLQSRNFASVKISASDLLRYRRSERERVADQVLPMLERRNISCFVNGVEKAHQASLLIDLGITGAQGGFIGDPRALRIYRDLDPLARKAEVSGSSSAG